MDKSGMDKGFTKVPNLILNNITKCQLSGLELKLVLLILRYSYGFSRDFAELSLGVMAEEVASSPKVISRKLKRLIESQIIIVDYVNSKTKVRAFRLNMNTDDWKNGLNNPQTDDKKTEDIHQMVDKGIHQTVDKPIHQTVDKPIHQMVDEPIHQTVDKVSTKWSPNKDNNINNNINNYIKIRERVNLTPKLEKGFIKWLEYKNERGEIYGRIPLKALCELLRQKADKWSENLVIEVIDDCIISGFKNIVWERLLRKAEEHKLASMSKNNDSFMTGYDHDALEKLSRGIKDDE